MEVFDPVALTIRTLPPVPCPSIRCRPTAEAPKAPATAGTSRLLASIESGENAGPGPGSVARGFDRWPVSDRSCQRAARGRCPAGCRNLRPLRAWSGTSLVVRPTDVPPPGRAGTAAAGRRAAPSCRAGRRRSEAAVGDARARPPHARRAAARRRDRPVRAGSGGLCAPARRRRRGDRASEPCESVPIAR